MRIYIIILLSLVSYTCRAQESFYTFDFSEKPNTKGISICVPDGNYKVTIKIGSKKKAGSTTIRGESRRLFIENLVTKKGEIVERTFVINKRNTKITDGEYVRIKDSEKTKRNWDDKLDLEFSGDNPLVFYLTIEKINNVTTVFLCGNSTVVDQEREPWASWGQMIPRFFDDRICFANYAESGESANTFIEAKRLKKLLTQMKSGDYIFIEFGHNDQKQTGPGKGAYYSYMTGLKMFIDEARLKGAYPILVTPTQRRRFEKGKIVNTHGEYPDAMKWLAHKENIPLIDLHSMTRILYEALGVEESKKAFVHYPANTFPNQTKTLEDNTHFNAYGAYQVAKCIVEGIINLNLSLSKHISEDFQPYDPAHPDDIDAFHWVPSKWIEIEKPDGN